MTGPIPIELAAEHPIGRLPVVPDLAAKQAPGEGVSVARTEERVAREVGPLAKTLVLNELTPTLIPALTPRYKPHHSQTGIGGGSGLLTYMSAAMAGMTIAPANKNSIALFIVSLRTQIKLAQVNPFPDLKVAPEPHFKINPARVNFWFYGRVTHRGSRGGSKPAKQRAALALFAFMNAAQRLRQQGIEPVADDLNDAYL